MGNETKQIETMEMRGMVFNSLYELEKFLIENKYQLDFVYESNELVRTKLELSVAKEIGDELENYIVVDDIMAEIGYRISFERGEFGKITIDYTTRLD